MILELIANNDEANIVGYTSYTDLLTSADNEKTCNETTAAFLAISDLLEDDSDSWDELTDTEEIEEEIIRLSDYLTIFDDNQEKEIQSREDRSEEMSEEIEEVREKMQKLLGKNMELGEEYMNCFTNPPKLSSYDKQRLPLLLIENDFPPHLSHFKPYNAKTRDIVEALKKNEKKIFELYSEEKRLINEHLYDDDADFSREDIYPYNMLGIMDADDRAVFIDKYQPNTMGYIQCLRDYFPLFFKALSKNLALRIPEPELRKHTYITGRTGSGKTELLKSILYDKIAQNRSAIVVLDPNGDFCKDIATFRHLHEQERLVYIDPVVFPDATPVLNPFDIADTSIEGIDISAQTLTQSIRESVKEGRLSNQMEVLLYPVIATLLQKGDADMKELQRFMDATSSDYLYKLGLQSKFTNHRDFFRTQFDTSTYEATKASIKTRIQSLLNSYIFSRLIEGKSSFDLESLIEQRKVIVFNLAKGKMGTDASAAYGRLILSTLQAIAYRRVNKDPEKRVTTYIAIDEFQNYITPSIESILTEARKYGLHLMFASQVSGQNMDMNMRRIALSCTNIKIVGANSRTAHEEIAGEIGIHANDLQTLGVGEFICKIGNSPPVRFRGTSELVKKSPKYYVSDDEWNNILTVQKARYYRDLTAQEEEKNATDAVKSRTRKHDDGLRPEL